jgi:hypothetical protein
MALGSLVRFWGAIDREPDLRFFDQMYATVHRHREEGENWEANGVSVRLLNTKSHSLLTVGHKRVSYEAINPVDLDKDVDHMAARLYSMVAPLAFGPLSRFGFKLVVYVDMGLSFEAMVDALRGLCLPQNPRFYELTSKTVTDLALAVDYDTPDFKAMFRAGPMVREQGLQSLASVGEHSRLFEPLQEGDSLPMLYRNIPEEFLFLDVDIFKTGDLPVETWTTFVSAAKQHALTAFQGIREMLEEATS